MVTYPSENEVLIFSKLTDPKGNLELLDWIFVIEKREKNVTKWEYKIIKWIVGSSCPYTFCKFASWISASWLLPVQGLIPSWKQTLTINHNDQALSILFKHL